MFKKLAMAAALMLSMFVIPPAGATETMKSIAPAFTLRPMIQKQNVAWIKCGIAVLYVGPGTLWGWGCWDMDNGGDMVSFIPFAEVG